MKRMDRYKEEYFPRESRTSKNQELYQNVSNNTIYTNITDVTNANAYDISNDQETSSKNTRESYQRMQKYQNMEEVPRTKKELDEINYYYPKKENKVYDINSVLEEARKNRTDQEGLEEDKRRLKNNEYNVLSGMNKEELEKFREERRKRLETPEAEEIRELIDTIASKTLAGEIDKATSVDLLSDLMATSILDRVEGNEEESTEVPVITESHEIVEEPSPTQEESLDLTKKIMDTAEIKELGNEEKKEEQPVKDPDFYTRSMDLSDKDFNMSDDFKEEKLPLPIKILLFLLIASLIAVAVYFIYQKIV